MNGLASFALDFLSCALVPALANLLKGLGATSLRQELSDSAPKPMLC